MKSKIVLLVTTASIAVVPTIAFAKAERPDKRHQPARHMSHRMTKPGATHSAIPSALPVKMTPAPAVAPKAK